MTFSDLDDAFRELERRADATETPLAVDRPQRHASTRPVLIAASAAAVVAVAVGGGVLASGGPSHQAAGSGAPVTPSTAVSAPISSESSAPSSSPSSPGPGTPATNVPKTQAELIARFHLILGSSATFTVDSANSSKNLITGVLTSTSGPRGLYVLELDKGVAPCGSQAPVGQPLSPLPCPGLTAQPDGSQLKVDDNFPDGPSNGVMNDAILNRPDDWQISLYTANVAGKYEGAPVLGTQPALTTKQVTDVVTSPMWLMN